MMLWPPQPVTRKMSTSILLLCACLLAGGRVNAQQSRDCTPQEARFMKLADQLIRQAVSRIEVVGWSRSAETPFDNDIELGFTTPKNQGPYSYSYELLFNWANSQDIMEATDSLTAVMVKDAMNPNNSLKIEELSGRYICRLKIEVNMFHTAQDFCGGQITHPKLRGVDQSTRVNINWTGPGGLSCPSTTVYYLGGYSVPKLYKHDNGKSGIINAVAKPVIQSPFQLHTVAVIIYAPAAVADQFAAQIDFEAIAQKINKTLQ